MIYDFEINNFRGIKKLKIEKLKPITLIAGKNNVGKSTILEALFLFNMHNDPNVFSILSGLRGATFEPPYRIWNPLFNSQDESETIVMSQNYKEDKRAYLEYKKNQSFAIDLNILPINEQNEVGLSSKITPYSLSFEYKEEEYFESGRFTVNNNGISMDIKTPNVNSERNLMPNTFICQTTLPRVEQQVVEWIGKLEILDKKEYAIEALKVIDPSIRDIVSASIDSINQLYIKNKFGTIPLKYAGDGMMRLLYITSILLTNENSLLLFDEIETGFHYSMYESLWRLIAKYSSKNNNQIIATSHSYENIARSLKGIEEEGCEDKFSLHRIERNANGEHEDLNYNFSSAQLAVTSGMEVR